MNGAPSAPTTSAATNLKRPRQSTGAAASAAAAGPSATTSSRVKRRKNDLDEGVGEGSESGVRGRGGSSIAVGGGKGKEDEVTESGEVQTKIDFKTLPIETLYKYLEHHDLLPKWEVSPWAEEPSVAPRELYNTASTSTTAAVADESAMVTPPTVPPADPEPVQPQSATTAVEPGVDGTTNGTEALNGEEDAVDDDQEVPAAPTTRSKTAPLRKEPTPPRANTPKVDALITLSDVYAARDVLAERANAHWAKGLGGGQNKESETIVNFLYKLKVEPGRLLRVYNPAPAPH